MGTPRACASETSKREFRYSKYFFTLVMRSILLAITTKALPSSIHLLASVSSYLETCSWASRTNVTTWTYRRTRIVSADANSSSSSVTFTGLRRPAVSTSRIRCPLCSHDTAIASRVMPGMGPVTTRSSPISWFRRVDFPTFGRPTIANSRSRPSDATTPSSLEGSCTSLVSCGTSACSVSMSTCARALYKSLRPSPCSAEISIGAPNPNLFSISAHTSVSFRATSYLLAMTTIFAPCGNA
mmetsp:Transcript_10448/g.17089  ORF Transcript_10448/g.17089 Transcript_10448/m.17089 type:complete len:241 (-) Transcript_10448:571-1293(-)